MTLAVVASAVRALALFAASGSLSALSDDAVVRELHVQMTGEVLRGTSCDEVFAKATEPGTATYRMHAQLGAGRRLDSGRLTAGVTFTVDSYRIDIPPAIVWDGMTMLDRQRAAALRRAVFHHEVGHIRVAQRTVDALNARPPLVAEDVPSLNAAADAAGRDGFARLRADERAYDELTDHGRRQHAAPGELTGPDTVIVCTARSGG